MTIGVIGNRQLYIGTTIARYEQTLLRGIRAAAQARGCNLLLACGIGPDGTPFEQRPAWPGGLPQADFVPVGPWNTDGLIVIPPFTAEQERALDTLRAGGHPLVLTSPHARYPSVGPDNAGGVAQACGHLIAHGHRRIAFLADGEQELGDGGERLAAFRAALAAHGLPFDPALLGYGRHNAREGYAATRRLIERGAAFTALLASNDESAIGALRALAEAGLRVPEDVAVVGFDDVLYAKAQTPPLTTVLHPTFDLGQLAVALLLDHIADRHRPVATARVPTRLIVRESCGCQPYGAPDAAAHSAAPATDALVQLVADAVASEARQSSAERIYEWSQLLVGALRTSLERADGQPFASALDQLLEAAEASNEDTHPWQAAIGALRDRLDWLQTSWAPAAPPRLAANLIDQARVRISERLRRQHIRFVMRQAELTDRIGAITSQLLTALEPGQILDILAAGLPQIGIAHAHIGLFEPDGNDPVAWSSLYVRAPAGPPERRRFPTRQFPPPDLYDPAAPVSAALLPLIIEGGPAGFVAFDTANLEPCGLLLRHLAAAFRSSQLHAEAERGRRLAEDASRLKSRFLSTVSHELRTPLNLIVGLSDLLLHDGAAIPAEAARQDLERIFANAQHLGRLIGDVLDLASSEAGQLRLHQEPLDLREVLQVVAATGAHMAQEKGLEWRASLPARGPLVRGDRTRLRQVALNLISNAIKFTDCGAVELEVSVAGDAAVVAVRDTGPGVPPEDQPRIFEEFYASERTAERAYGGLGLGLAICKQLIVRHGGTIGVSSPGEPGSGATFFFSLPLLAAAPPPERPPPAPDERPLLLFLTEQAQPSEQLSAALGELGCATQVQSVDQGGDWLRQLLERPPDALILDGALAGRHGWEILGLLKHHQQTARLPVLMYARDQGGQCTLLDLDYLQKPLEADQLAQLLERHVGQAEQPPAARAILIVDDNPDMLALHSQLVRQQLGDCRVATARDGRAALEAMGRERPSLVLLDLMMPRLDGFGVLEQMRARPELADVPVVVLTSRVLSDDDLDRLNAGVAAILSKGLFSDGEIAAQLKAALGQQRRPGRATEQVVRRASAFIHASYAEPLTRDHVAGHVGVSADYLTACFRQELGVTPIAYLNRYRVSRARELLEQSHRSVTEVAMAVGFGDLATFSRQFHREVGMSPNAYRRARRA